MATTVSIPDTITVGDLAERLTLPATKLIAELMKLGVMVTVNEKIDFDTVEIIIEELGIEVDLKHELEDDKNVEGVNEVIRGSNKLVRPPIVAVMGHVDHGKTSLLDAIRGTNVVKAEAGGITQHISAYQITHKDRLITLLDTPGHEAFAALREHGAKLTDLAIIVVAADDGVKPQTVEAIRFAKNAGVRIIVAINKIDKPEANPNLVKQQLAEQGVLVEGYGGDVVAVEVSAKTKLGIDSLLDMIILIADLEEMDAYTDVPANGLVIESHMETGRGPVAEVLVEGGVLKSGDHIVAGTSYARIRNLENADGKAIKEATPSTPAIITGFKSLPNFGDRFRVVKNEREAKEFIEKRSRQKTTSRLDLSSSDLLKIINRKNTVNELKVVVKADVQGSLVSVIDSLKGLDTDDVAIKIVGSGVGPINENDINLAKGSDTIIYGFNVIKPKSIELLAERNKVTVRLYNVIYELIEDARSEMSNLLAPEILQTDLGELKIKGIFKVSKNQTIAGGEVLSGRLEVPALAKVTRGDKVIAEDIEIDNLKRGPQDVKEVQEGEMCGIGFKTSSRLDLAIDDLVGVYKKELVERQI